MVILCIYSTCWCMKSVFYERQQPALHGISPFLDHIDSIKNTRNAG
jgi:hypothetical protein